MLLPTKGWHAPQSTRPRRRRVVKNLFAENPGVVIQVSDDHRTDLRTFLDDEGIGYTKIGYSVPNSRTLVVKKGDNEFVFDIDSLRETWYRTSYRLDTMQSHNGMAKKRWLNYKKQPNRTEV